MPDGALAMSEPIGALAEPDMAPEPEVELPAMPVASLALPELIDGVVVVVVVDEVDDGVVEVELSIGALAPAVLDDALSRPQPLKVARASVPAAASAKRVEDRVVMGWLLGIGRYAGAARVECDGGSDGPGVSRCPVGT